MVQENGKAGPKGVEFRSFGLENSIALVTGPTQGIGHALALGLARSGADVALVSRTEAALEEVACQIRGLGRRALVLPADVASVDACRTVVQQTVETFGRLDILINNAAWTGMGPALDVVEEEWDRTLDVSLKGVFFMAQAAARVMTRQGGGKIVNMGSTFGVVAFQDRAVYSAVKGAIHQLTRVLALEWADQGVHVNGVAPCITETPTRRNLFERPGYQEWATGTMLPIGRWAQPGDLVGAALFLCSSLSDMVVGHTLMVDGGWTIH